MCKNNLELNILFLPNYAYFAIVLCYKESSPVYLMRKGVYFKVSISKTNENNLSTEKQSSGLGIFKRQTGIISLLMAWPLRHEKIWDGLLTTSKQVVWGCFRAALQKAAFESLDKVGSTFGCRTEAAWDETVSQKKLDWGHAVWEKAKQFAVLLWLSYQWVFDFQRKAVLLLALWFQLFGHSEEMCRGSCSGKSPRIRKFDPSCVSWNCSISTLGRAHGREDGEKCESTRGRTWILNQDFEDSGKPRTEETFYYFKACAFFPKQLYVDGDPDNTNPIFMQPTSLKMMSRWNPVKKTSSDFFYHVLLFFLQRSQMVSL